MGILHKLADGTVQIFESFDLKPFGTEEDRSTFELAMSEAVKEGKSTKLVAKVAAMPSAITRNKTFYPAEELRASLESWTNPYPCPVIKDHNEWAVDNIVGRINEAYMQPDDGVDTLWFEVSILDAEAQEKIANGTWAQVSIGTRVGSAVCSVCGNDWAKGTWCEHERGNYYLKDESDPNSMVQCFWIMSQIGGREVSIVTTPSAATAGFRDMKQASEAEDTDSRFSQIILAWAESDETVESTLAAIEAVTKLGSPSSNGEAIVPSDKEEGVEKPKTDEVEVITPSGADSEGEENVEAAAKLVDGQEAEVETDPSTVVEGEEPEAPEATAEGEAEPESPASDEGAEAEGEAAEGGEAEGEEAPEQPAEPVAEGEGDDELGLVARVAELEAEVLSLKAQLFVESGLRDGILAGERDALVEAHTEMSESTLDELIEATSKRRSRVNVSEELLKHQLEPKDSEGKPAGLSTDDDKHADANVDEYKVSVKTETGTHVVKLQDDNEPVTVTPKL